MAKRLMEPDGIPSNYRPENAWSYDEEDIFACDGLRRSDPDLLEEQSDDAEEAMVLEPDGEEELDEMSLSDFEEDRSYADSDVLDDYFGAAGGVMVLEPDEDEKFDEKRLSDYDEDQSLMSRALEELGTNFIAASEVGEIVQRDENQRNFGQMIENIMAARSLEELHDILVECPDYSGAGLLAEACSERIRKRDKKGVIVRLVG